MTGGGRRADYEPYPFYLTAWEEDKHVVGQANIELDEVGNIVNERNAARKAGEFILALREDIEYVDVSPKQLVSVAASLIPFLENDDANRALMGPTCSASRATPARQRRTSGRGWRSDGRFGRVVTARRDGVVIMLIRARHHQVRHTLMAQSRASDANHTLTIFSDQTKTVHQSARDRLGRRAVDKSSHSPRAVHRPGELALVRKCCRLYAWRGYNLRTRSRLLAPRQDTTTLHPHREWIRGARHEAAPRDTRTFQTSRDMLRDSTNRAHRSARGQAWLDLVCKVTPQGETQLTARKTAARALREKAGDVKDFLSPVPAG